ncbi:MAG: hypothetical protein WC817_02200 [Patescibacteria group bacterium]|jgi:hypothetical protein
MGRLKAVVAFVIIAGVVLIVVWLPDWLQEELFGMFKPDLFEEDT